MFCSTDSNEDYDTLNGEVFNNVGQKIKSITTTENNIIPISTKGIYFIKVDNRAEKVVLK